MRRPLTYADRHDRFATLLDDDSKPPCSPPDDCPVCRLFDGQRQGESRAEWISRITGQTDIELEAAS